MFVYAGDPADGPAAIEPFREVATPLAELAVPMPYPGIYALLEAAEHRGFEVARSRFLDRIDDDAVDAMLGAIEVAPSPMAMIQVRILGGAMARVPSDATAFVHRDAKVMVAVLDPYEDPSTKDVQVAWVEALHEALAPNCGRRVLELPRARGRGPDPRGLRRPDVPAPVADQAPLRPDEPVPPQPEHPARRLD